MKNKYAITIAVAGFQDSEIDVQVEKGILTVRGKEGRATKDSRIFTVVSRHVLSSVSFNLADHVEVVSAQLDNGLLKVSLLREIPEAMKPRNIPVGNAGRVLEDSTVS